MLTLALLFTLAVLVVHATDSSYDNNNETMPGTMIGAMIALYLGATFVIGLVTPMRVGAVGPVLAYPVATLLWPLISGGAYDRAYLRVRVGWGSALRAGADGRHLAGRLYRPAYWAGRWKRGHRPTNNLAMLRGLGCERRGLP